MKFRTADELSSVVRSDLAYRRKEVLVYEAMVRTASPRNKQASLRGAVAVLYAHWEGFVKCSLQTYVDHVRSQRKNVCELIDSFVAMAARKHLHMLKEAQRPQPHAEFVKWFRSGLAERAHLPQKSIVDTQSNLSVEVLRDLMGMVGLEYRSEYAVAEKPVIERLLALRNGLAHGDWEIIDETEWTKQLHPRITDLLEILCSQIEAAAWGRNYLQQS